MLLAIDAGNTNTVFAIVNDEGVILEEWRAQTVASRTADEHAVWLASLLQMERLTMAAIDRVIISSVVPQGLFQLTTLARRYIGCEPLVVGEGLKLGLEVRLPDPREVGADRLVNAVAALSEYQADLIVVDFGTATTLDVVGGDGAYLGGVISPGINLSLEALHNAAAKLPRIAVSRPERVIGSSTVSAMQSGVFWGYVGLIDGLVERIKAEFGRPMTVVATGGLAHWFADATDHIDHVDRDLTIKGLIVIEHMNRDMKT